MVIGSYISIITLNVNGLNAPTKRDWWDGYKNKTHIYMLSKRDPPQSQGHLRDEK